MTTKVTTEQEATHEALTQLRRPRLLSALLTAEAVAKVDDKGVKSKANGGRWCLNAGSEMVTYVWGLNTGRDGYPQPIRCVLDLARTTFENAKIPSLFAHSSWALIGNWTNLEAEDDGLFGDQTIYLPQDPSQTQIFTDSIRVKSLMDQDHPWQASVGCYPADGLDGYQLVADGKELKLNGRVYAGAGELPLYVMRKPVVFEASVVLWGADSETGRLAAALLNPSSLRAAQPAPAAPPKESTMSDIKRLQGLLARFKGHDATVAQQFAAGKSDDEISAEVFRIQAETIATLQAAPKPAAVAAAAPAPAPVPAQPSAGVVAAAAAAPAAPAFVPSATAGGAGTKTFAAARAELSKENPNLKGLSLNEAVFERYPDLRPNTSRFGSMTEGVARG